MGTAVLEIGRVLAVGDTDARRGVIVARVLQPQRMADFMGEGLATVLVLMDLIVDEGMVLGVIRVCPATEGEVSGLYAKA